VWVVTPALLLGWAAFSAFTTAFDPSATGNGVGYGSLMFGMATLGLLVVRRRPRDPVGWIFMAAPALVCASIVGGNYAEWSAARGSVSPPVVLAAWVTSWAWPVGLSAYALVVPLLFPTGTPPGPRWRWLLRADVVVLTLLFFVLATDPGEDVPGITNPVGLGVSGSEALRIAVAAAVLVLMALGLASAVVRFRRAVGVERTQMRLCVAAACVSGVGFVVLSLLLPFGSLYTLDYALLPAAMGAAMLRHRLYDVDVIIRRTLVYAALTAALAGCYLGGVAGLGALLRIVTGQSGTLAVTLSTLATAAAFQPLRRRIGRVVDRRFARERYDAERALSALTGRLRDGVELDAIRDDVLDVVEATVRHRSASLWLRPTGSVE
jgi:hypothetical protein